MAERYNHAKADSHWQRVWEEQGSFHADDTSNRPKSYVLEMFPYPSGRIHMGHVRNYTMGDVLARFRRMRGMEVLHPMGWDAFGMPAENAAMEKGVHPGDWTRANIAAMRAQLKTLGFALDWSREARHLRARCTGRSRRSSSPSSRLASSTARKATSTGTRST